MAAVGSLALAQEIASGAWACGQAGKQAGQSCSPPSRASPWHWPWLPPPAVKPRCRPSTAPNWKQLPPVLMPLLARLICKPRQRRRHRKPLLLSPCRTRTPRMSSRCPPSPMAPSPTRPQQTSPAHPPRRLQPLNHQPQPQPLSRPPPSPLRRHNPRKNLPRQLKPPQNQRVRPPRYRHRPPPRHRHRRPPRHPPRHRLRRPIQTSRRCRWHAWHRGPPSTWPTTLRPTGPWCCGSGRPIDPPAAGRPPASSSSLETTPTPSPS